jgi:hypothetical protein
VVSHSEKPAEFDNELVAELLDQHEYPSNIGKVAALSSRWICFVKRDWHELTHFRLEYFEMQDCRAIKYHKETAWYRILVAIVFFAAALFLVSMLLTNSWQPNTQSAPLIVGVIALTVIGIRFITSTHRHVVRFEMPEETFTWRSPAIDFDSKADAARAVQDYARNRGILRESET